MVIGITIVKSRAFRVWDLNVIAMVLTHPFYYYLTNPHVCSAQVSLAQLGAEEEIVVM